MPARCRRSLPHPARLALAALAALALAAACGARPALAPPPPVIVAGDRLAELDLATGRALKMRPLPAPATDLALTADGELVAVTTLAGAAFLARADFAVLWSEDLGIVDAVELAPDGSRAYLLLHPGSDPREATAEHTLLEVAVPGGEHRRSAALPARAYDLLLDPPTGAVYATALVGRSVHRVDLDTFAVSEHEIGLGRGPEVEPEMALLRVLVPGPRPGALCVLEDLRTRARLWDWEPASGRLVPHELPGIAPPVLGGGPVAGGVWLFTRHEFLRLSADFEITARSDLAGAATDSAAYRHAAADGKTALLLAAIPPAGGRARSRATWIDLATGAAGGGRRLDLRAGPVALLPGGDPR